MAAPYESEIQALSAVTADGLVARYSYATWRDATPYPVIPPDYAGTADAFKWGDRRPGFGATISYWFDPAWDATERAAFEGSMALWMAVANVDIVAAASSAAADFQIVKAPAGSKRGDWGNVGFEHPKVGDAQLGTLPHSADNRITVDPVDLGPLGPMDARLGYSLYVLMHELGHMLGLGHGGPYDGRADAMVQQFGPYDTRLWTAMSYIEPSERALYSDQYPVTGTEWNGYWPLTPMMLDILAVQRLYGVSPDGPLTGGKHIFGFNTNIQGPVRNYFDFDVNRHPVVTIWENGRGNTLDLSKFTQDAVIDLHPGNFSSAGGMKNNIGIAFGTVIETGIGGSGDDTIYASDVDSFLHGNQGTDILLGGAGNDLLRGGADPDAIDGGGGLNVLRDSLGDLNGDTVFHFGQSTTIEVWGALIGRDNLTVTVDDGNTTLGMGNTQILLIGGFEGGDFMAVARNNGELMHTDVTFEPWLPHLQEGVSVANDLINGVSNQPFMTGDSVVRFAVDLREAVSAFANTLGWYTVAVDGAITGVDILWSNTRAAGTASIALGAPASGEQIAFFLIQDGFGRFGSLPDDLSFLGNAHAGLPLVLQSATLGTLDATIFHSIQSLNPGDAIQVLSGAAPGGRDLQIGFEDLATATGDNDFQDVVINLHTDRNDVLFG